ncbi:U32 family peptidase [uncultured Olegusella sp.]|uniref:U32 family peptidase n=1 Tax=uncultured Olegusella sp. TaxID=1979846 RepID=UPI0026068474|nr:U32 family peptidase [uncultured Olegusella sp.]
MTNQVGARQIPELLAPAGGPEAFYAALAAGADAIYCGLGSDFNARRAAHNFSEEEFREACRVAHIAGARVYVTQNVVIKENELERAVRWAVHAWVLGADAIIVQDWGLMSELRRRRPDIEIHVSTQANLHDGRAVAWVRDVLGVERVTLSRELSLAEISRIAQEGVELENFGHGALCFCYSGICKLSSSVGKRSANRGLCAQPCRLLYDLVDSKGRVIAVDGRTRPLCPKDYCTISDLAELSQAGLASLKVEGRMKAADYVWSVVSAYRGALDDVAAGRTPRQDDINRRRDLLLRSFNRDFTDAYLRGHCGDEMMSYDRSNNRGELAGEVLASRDLGSFRRVQGGSAGGRERTRMHHEAEVTLRVDVPVGKGDLLELRPLEDPSQFLTTLASKDVRPGEILICRTVRTLPEGSVVRVIRSQAALDASALAARPSAAPKRAVTMRVRAHRGMPLTVEMSCVDGSASVCAEGDLVEAARTKAVTAEDLAEHAGRLGNSAFEARAIDVELDEGVGLGFSSLHKLRSRACRLLEKELLADYEGRFENVGVGLRGPREKAALRADMKPVQTAEICALVVTPEAARRALAAGAHRVYVRDDLLSSPTLSNWPDKVIPWLDEVCRQADRRRIDSYIVPGGELAVGNVSELAAAVDRGAYPEIRACIPVHNASCLSWLEAQGAQGFWLSSELSLEEIRQIASQAKTPVGVTVSGRIRAMTSEHCILQAAGQCIEDCARCGLRKQRLSLRSRDGSLLPVRTDLQGRSRLYAARPLDLAPEIGELLSAGVSRLMVDCSLLGEQEVGSELRRIQAALLAAQTGKRPALRLVGSDTGHLLSPID